MKRITLRLKQAPALRIDARELLPARLAELATRDICAIALWHGAERISVGELFAVEVGEGTRDAPQLVFEGDMQRFDRLGMRMHAGHILVDGDAGDFVGLQMSAGTVLVEGHCGSFAACELTGGRIEIRGNAGDFAGAALPGDMDGMRGGTLVVHGDAGARLGDRMRRGTIAVFGSAGAFVASRMVAGTIAITGKVGEHPAYGMRRGSLVLLDPAWPTTPRFAENSSDIDVFWRLLVPTLAREGGPFAMLSRAHAPQRLRGDVSVQGKGEILLPR
ncbi:formylmethanofuran dehydrogenase subunit C [Paraburkholderia phymatum]|uniref:Formylmethanofuran dehydrogenase subunit C n=1 Tax=Paraburkholderia phymatum (strain DSM 17167 / CIP 108236 / LMG 21445 / STM815) TaxID=391038 RepID=B2JVL9_PARP8|nr:formylmethanofuran dehydrogenase subunit C [Paraburkholderia phymatum]ACC74996.1 formylmethanofuran dehydrogenase subunit C [Paraburkholderia phymatum STM815]